MRYNLTIFSVLLLANFSYAEESYSAKSLFFGEDDSVIAVSTARKTDASTPITRSKEAPKQVPKIAKKSATPTNIGVSYFVRLKNPDGSTKDVLSSRKFKSGERFQLGVKVNRPSYVYILNEESDGKVTQLYPQPGRSNYIDAMGVVFLPSKGAFEFDNQPGTEQLLVYVSPKPIQAKILDDIKSVKPDMVSLTHSVKSDAAPENCSEAPESSMKVASVGDEYAAKGITFAADPACKGPAIKHDSAEYASKGITFSDDEETSAASYVVKKATTPDSSLYLKVKLNHQ